MAIDSSKISAVATAIDNKYENKQTNKKSDISGDFTNDNTSYPTVNAVKTLLSGFYLTNSEINTLLSSYVTSNYLTTFLNDYALTSSIPTNTSDLTNDGDGSNPFLTEHQSLSDIGGVVDVDEKVSPNNGAFKTYEITQGGVSVGEIDIPKDFLVKSGSVKTVGSTPTTAETDANLSTGDLYISLIINTKDNQTSTGDNELIIPTGGLVENRSYDADNSTILLTGTTFSIKSGGVTVTELANDAVETSKIKDSNVTTAKIADANVTSAKLATNSVTTDKITDSNVTYAKLSSTCISSLGSDTESIIEDTLDALAEAINPTQGS